MSIDAYIAARTAFVQAHSNVHKLSETIMQVGRALNQQPSRFIFANSEPGLPAEASMSRDSVSIDAKDWKSAPEIMELLAAWHKARSSLLSAWDAVGPEERNALQPPPQSALPSRTRH